MPLIIRQNCLMHCYGTSNICTRWRWRQWLRVGLVHCMTKCWSWNLELKTTSISVCSWQTQCRQGTLLKKVSKVSYRTCKYNAVCLWHELWLCGLARLGFKSWFVTAWYLTLRYPTTNWSPVYGVVMASCAGRCDGKWRIHIAQLWLNIA